MPRRDYRALVLAAMPGTSTELMDKTGLSRTTVWRWSNDLHAAGECHISAWTRVEGGGPFMPTYSPGPGKDVRCFLKAYTEMQKSRRFRARARRDGRWEDIQARQRAKYWADKAQPDPLVALFFGMGAARPSS